MFYKILSLYCESNVCAGSGAVGKRERSFIMVCRCVDVWMLLWTLSKWIHFHVLYTNTCTNTRTHKTILLFTSKSVLSCLFSFTGCQVLTKMFEISSFILEQNVWKNKTDERKKKQKNENKRQTQTHTIKTCLALARSFSHTSTHFHKSDCGSSKRKQWTLHLWSNHKICIHICVNVYELSERTGEFIVCAPFCVDAKKTTPTTTITWHINVLRAWSYTILCAYVYV